MFLHLIYIIAFTVLAFLAVTNLIRNLMILGSDSRRSNNSPRPRSSPDPSNSHPELLDESGQVVREPYLVMRSISMEDAREKLDALYDSSPGGNNKPQEDSED